ncbi:MAG: L,D-transpeptidase family protein [Clostridiales Family XIII bacterium]|jgi:hypothetical protein|nr:L,D-transpeptidase family protein [Clostridiales Family XIII bacterium]
MTKTKGFRIFIIAVACALGALCAYLIWAYDHYSDHVPPGTMLAGEDVGGYTFDEAKATGQEIYDSIVMDLALADDSGVASVPAITKTLTADDLGIVFDADATAQAAMDSAADEWFISKVNPFVQKSSGLSIVVDDAATTAKIEEYFGDAVFKNKLPKVKYDKKEKAFTVTAGVVGTSLDMERFLTELKGGALRAGESEYDVHLNPLPPAISDEAAIEAKDIADKAMKSKVNFKKDGKVAYKASRNSKASWITFTADKEGGKYDVGVDTEKVAEFLKTTASENLVEEPLPRLVVKEIDIEGAKAKAKKPDGATPAGADEPADADDQKDEPAKGDGNGTDGTASADGEGSDEKGSKGADENAAGGAADETAPVTEPAPKPERMVRDGKDGLAIANRDELANQIKDRMLAFKNIELNPQYETIPFETEEIGPDFGKWIETDLTHQRTYLWDGNRKLKTFVVSTGRDATPTIVGTFYIYMKRSLHTMIGYENGKKIYETPNVRWISYFSGAYAYHAAYWHNNFGRQMSHGCVNMKTPEAKYLYDWAPVGTKTIVHY